MNFPAFPAPYGDYRDPIFPLPMETMGKWQIRSDLQEGGMPEGKNL